MEKITSELAGVKTAAIAGHVRPENLLSTVLPCQN